MVHTPLICDLAIAIGSVISYTDDPVSTIIDYLIGTWTERNTEETIPSKSHLREQEESER
jgi:hypothetical protein